eukprot:1363897-Rhodomonas_salina.5
MSGTDVDFLSIVLRMRYAMSGTDIDFLYAMSGTDIDFLSIVLRMHYAMSGTEKRFPEYRRRSLGGERYRPLEEWIFREHTDKNKMRCLPS